MNFNEIKTMSDQFLMPTYAKFGVALKSGKGATLTGVDGKEYIDFTSGIGVNSLGCCDDKWVKAVSEQAGELQHISNLYYVPVVAECAKALCEKSGFDRVFFCNSGAEANECAIKLARKYSYDKYGEKSGPEFKRNEIITLGNSFHGRTMAALTATGQDSFHDYFYPFLPGFKYAPANDIEAFKSLADENTCAVMLEFIQGEGGVVPLDECYVKELFAYCQERDILVIADEVQTGIGRTGKLFAWELSGLKPDILTAAKGLAGGLPMGACLCVKSLGEVLGLSAHGTTFGGNPVCCAAALAVLDRMDDDFLASVSQKGEYIKSKLHTMPKVKGVRGMGLMLGIELEGGIDAKQTASECAKNGLLILTAKTLLRMLPPLVITIDEIDRGLAALQKTLSDS